MMGRETYLPKLSSQDSTYRKPVLGATRRLINGDGSATQQINDRQPQQIGFGAAPPKSERL
jgi:hypothetical protein